MIEKLPPHDPYAEASVIASCTLDDDAVFKVLDLDPADFWNERHVTYWQAIRRLAESFDTINSVSVAQEAARSSAIPLDEAHADLLRMEGELPTTVHIQHYAGIVKRTARYRRLISASARLAQQAYAQVPVEQIQDDVLRAFSGLDETDGDFESVADILERHGKAIDAYRDNPAIIRGVSTSLPKLDRIIGGWRPGDYIVMAARTAVGKTALALQFAYHAAKTTKQPVAYASFEMAKFRLTHDRLTHGIVRLNRALIRARGWNPGERDKHAEGMRLVREVPLYILDTRGITTATLHGRLTRLIARHGQPALVVVDQLYHLTDRADNEVQRLGTISTSLMTLAGQLQVPILALHQINRGVVKREDKRPMLDDLRDSGKLEQDADVVLMLHRENYYDQSADDTLEIIVRKNRDGDEGSVFVTFERETGRFREPTRQEQQP